MRRIVAWLLIAIIGWSTLSSAAHGGPKRALKP